MPTPPIAFPGWGSIPNPRSGLTWCGVGLLFVTILAIFVSYYILVHPPLTPQEMTQTQLFQLIKEGQVETIVNEPDPSTGTRTLTGTYKKPVSVAPNAPEVEAAFKVPVDLLLSPYLASEIQQAGYKGIIETRTNTPIFWPLVLNLLPIILFVGLMFLFFGSLAWFLYKTALWASQHMSKT